MWKKSLPLIISFGILIVLAISSAQAWHDSDYTYRRNHTLPTSNATSGTAFPCVINGSGGGFDMGDPSYNQVAWGLCRVGNDDTYLYYNNNTDYILVNETAGSQMHLDVEYGNGTSYEPISLWRNIDGLRARFAMNGTAYDSTDQFQGTPTSASYTIGRFGEGFESDNTNRIDISCNIFDKTADVDFSVSGWFKTNGDQGANKRIVSFRDGSGSNVVQMIQIQIKDDGKFRAYTRDSDVVDVDCTTTGTGYEDDNWHHFVAVKDGNTLTLYTDGGADIDGETISDSDTLTGNYNANDECAIGTDVYQDNNGLNGVADEILFFNRSLTQNEAEFLYEVGREGYLDTQETNPGGVNPPVITWNSPANATYFQSDVLLNVTLTDETYATINTTVYIDGVYNSTQDIGNNSEHEQTFEFTGGQHYISINASNDGGEFTYESRYFYVFAGLNASAFDSSTGNSMTDWDIFITNGTSNYTNTTLNNPSLLEWSNLPTGSVNITFSDGSDTEYYFNSTYERNINNSDILVLEGQLTEKPTSTIDLDASPSWTVDENTAITVTCSASEGTPTLERDGITISNPFNSVLPFGSYNFTCSIGETDNYAPATQTTFLTVQSGGFGCTNTSTYAFSRTITVTSNPMTLNFASLIGNSFVKDDLSDVTANVDTTIYKNESEKSIIINTTGYSSFTVKFGNYASNNTYTETATSGNTVNMTSYSEINSYYVLTFLEETDGTQQLPPDGNITVSLICSQGTSSVDVNESKVLFATFDDQADEIKTTVTYSATEYYSRNRIIDAPIEYLDVYLVDANEHQVAQMLISLQDATGDFLESKFIAKKYLEGTLETITEHYFDAERKVVVYLINGDKYQVYVDNGDEQRNIGYLYIDPIDLSKTINIGEILTINQSVANITYTLEYDASTTSIVFSMNDPEGYVIGTEFWVWNQSEDLIYYANSSNHSQVSYTYVVPNASQDYKAKAKIHHPFYGENSITFFRSFSLGFTAPAFPFMFPFVGSFLFGWQTFIVVNGLIFTSLLFGGRDSKGGIIFVVILGGIFAYFGWWVADALVLGLAGFLAILNKMTERRHIE